MQTLKTADLCDRLGADAQVCLAPMRSFGGRRAASGPIATVRAFEDAALVRQQLGQPGEGRILVVDAGGLVRVAILGDNMARLGAQNGWAGVLVNGAVRDVDALGQLAIAVFALGGVPARGGNAGVGEVGVELRFGGIAFAPGRQVAMDSDGVVVF
ncbi:MAG: ribonuclease E inhibitor RraA [Variovorax sp.]|nr:MAG: ribonuclease E inhibitor RraA [Variovorax sp.]